MAAPNITELQIKFMLEQLDFTFNENGLKAFLLDKKNLSQRSVLGGNVIGDGFSLQAQEYIYHEYLSDEQKLANNIMSISQ